MYTIGSRLKLSKTGVEMWHIFEDTKARATVVRPGVSRSGMYVRLRVDGSKKEKTYSTNFWEAE